MTIQDIENAIIGRLKLKITKLHIQGFTQKAVEFAMKHPVGALLVTFKGSNFKAPSRTLGIICQERKVKYGIILMTKNLRVQDSGHIGAYEILDAVRICLTGFQIPGCSKMYPTVEDFIAEKDGVWQYGVIFEMTTENVEALEDEEAILLNKITTIDHLSGDTQVTEKEK